MADQSVLALVDGVVTEVLVQAGGSAAVPFYIQPNTDYTVETGTQALFRKRITLGSGARIKLKGILVGV